MQKNKRGEPNHLFNYGAANQPALVFLGRNRTIGPPEAVTEAIASRRLKKLPQVLPPPEKVRLDREKTVEEE